MQAMRDVLKTTLGRSLAALSPTDRLAAAWPVAAGRAIAERSSILSLDGTTVTVRVADAAWQRQLEAEALTLRSELSRVARVPLTAILFRVGSAATGAPNQPHWPDGKHA